MMKSNYKSKLWAPAMAGLALVCGCIPEKRVVWTHDGQMAAVVADEGVYLINGDGNVLPGRAPVKAARAAWSRDAKRLLVVHRTEISTWKEASEILTPAQREQVIEQSKVAKPRIMSHTGEWDKFKLLPDESAPGGLVVSIILYLRDNDQGELREKLGDEWKEISEIKPNLWHLQSFTREGDELRPGTTLFRTLDDIVFPTASPDDRYVAFNSEYWGGEQSGVTLFVVPSSGGEAIPAAVKVAKGFDWSPDSRQLAYVRSPLVQNGVEEMLHLGSLATIRMRGEDGALLDKPAEPEDRVGLLFNPVTCIKWLRDGRILFASVELTLPATKHDMPRRWAIFVSDPRVAASVMRVLGRDFDEPIEPSFALFEVSPDETRVLIPCDKSQTAVYTLATGESTPVLPPDGLGSKTLIVPTWRDNHEICFAQPQPGTADGKETWEIALWKDGETRVISKEWPEAMRREWLEK